MSDFATRVRAALQSKGISIRAAAARTNYDAAYLSRVLNGKQQPSKKLASALDDLLHAEGALAKLANVLDPDEHARVAQSVSARSRLDWGTVKALADVLAAQRRLDDVFPAAAMIPATAAQWKTVERLAKEARGTHAADIHSVAAEWVQFLGWLHAEARNDELALRYLGKAQDRADALDDGPLIAQSANFKGYLARQQGRPRAVIRWFLDAYHTVGATPLQRVGDAVQAAHGFALIGHSNEARRLLDEAAELADSAVEIPPPETAYWLSPTFSHMGIGLTLNALGDCKDAVHHLQTGLNGLPEDQRDSEWSREYREALEHARSAA